MSAVATLSWQFHGPRSGGIAEHHARHLREFATANQVDAEVEVLCPSAAQAEVHFRVPADLAGRVAARLKPHRLSLPS